MGGVLVDDDQAVAGLGDDIGAVQLGPGGAERIVERVDPAARFIMNQRLIGEARMALDPRRALVQARNNLGVGAGRGSPALPAAPALG